MIVRVASLAFALYVFWLLLSGHYSAFLLGAGALAAIAIAYAGRLFGYADREGHPVELIIVGRPLLALAGDGDREVLPLGVPDHPDAVAADGPARGEAQGRAADRRRHGDLRELDHPDAGHHHP